ncbi:MAG: nickel pincer cofactor biosynthesis protein LarC [Proteobacteria bacterium]|nr:nickel pincer cofactor biosynthesis protein LarC [Pseudomonadota bacterium]
MSQRSSTGSSRRRRAAAGGARILHLDPFSGISGNMFLGALLDAGLSRKELEADLAGLGLPHRLRISRVHRGALAGRYVRVQVPGAKPRRKPRARKAAPDPVHAAEPHQAHGHAHGRRHSEIVRILRRAELAAPIRARALTIYEALAAAEARVHNIPVERVHFHEVGAVDAIVDITGAASGLERLGIERVTSSPVALGHGQVETDHGRLPVPAPATVELLKGIPSVPAHAAFETVTPTGAAILRAVVDEFVPLPAMTIESQGYGAGDDRAGPMPNLLRAIVGRASQAGSDRVAVLETNLDDLVPEHFDHLMERLFEAGALDVTLAHQQMKKNRPGFLVRALARPSERLAVARVLFAESTAIGVRTSEWDRLVLERESVRVDTPYGRVRVKRVRGLEGALEVSPEYDDCKRAAARHGVALRRVVEAARRAADTES